jgi:hypothetical protein
MPRTAQISDSALGHFRWLNRVAVLKLSDFFNPHRNRSIHFSRHLSDEKLVDALRHRRTYKRGPEFCSCFLSEKYESHFGKLSQSQHISPDAYTALSEKVQQVTLFGSPHRSTVGSELTDRPAVEHNVVFGLLLEVDGLATTEGASPLSTAIMSEQPVQKQRSACLSSH